MRLNIIGYIGLGMILVSLTHLITNKFFPRVETVTRTDTMYTIKTIKVPIEKIVYRNIPVTRVETVKVSDSISTLKVSAEKVLGKDNDTVKVSYSFPPINPTAGLFDIYLGLTPREIKYKEKIIITTNDIHHYPTFWDKALWFGAGVGSVLLIKKVDEVASGSR